MVWHRNQYGFRENLDSLPAADCSCDKCIRAAERQDRGRRRKQGRVARGIASAAIGIAGAVTNPGLAANALPGQESEAAGFGQRWKESSQNERRNGQARGMNIETRAKGDRNAWSSEEDEDQD